MARFDGLEFDAFTVTDGLPSNFTYALAADVRGRVWAGTSGGLAVFRDGRFARVAAQALPTVRALAADGPRLWATTGTDGVAVIERGRLRTLTTADGLPSNAVTALAAAGGTAWAATDAGLARIDDGRVTPLAASGLGHPYALAVAPDGVWALAPRGLVRVRGGRVTLRPFTPADGVGGALSILADAQGRVWVGTEENAVVRFDGTAPGVPRQARFTRQNGLPPQQTLTLFAGSAGEVWGGMQDAGTWVLADEAFAHYGEADGLGTGSVWTSTEIDGVLYVGATDGLYRQTPDGFVHDRRAAAGTYVSKLFRSRTGDLWIATTDRLLRETPSGHRRVYTAADGLDAPHVVALADGPDGRLWVGTVDGLFAIPPNGPVREYTEADGLPDPYVNDFLVDPSGTLWVASDGGISRLVGDRLVEVPTGHGTAGVNSLAAMPDGSVWGGSPTTGCSATHRARRPARPRTRSRGRSTG